LVSLQRRREIYALCSRYDVVIIEDDPYFCLQYPSVPNLEATARSVPLIEEPGSHNLPKKSGYPFIDSLVPSYLQIDTDGRVIRLDTFSKTIAPGCRLGWITAQPVLIERILRVTEASTAQPSGFVQAMVAELLIGDQPAKAEFARKTRAEQKAFTGWKVDGWVRWIEGLCGSYERRMTRMCNILEDGRFQLKQGTPLKSSESDWAVISKTEMYTFDWPHGGMFVWVCMCFDTHPLASQVPGPRISHAFWIYLTQKPNLLLVAPGQIFSPTPEIAAQDGWKYFRLCFAAVDEQDVEQCSERFARAVATFWAIKNKKELEDIDEDEGEQALEMRGGVQMFNLGLGMGC
jgi:DNA-binding transcriptional MocR family regulator